MDYRVKKNEILIIGKTDFNPKHILECGQIFRYYYKDGVYTVYSKDKRAQIYETSVGYTIKTNAPHYFEEFFNLKTDYGKIKNEIITKFPFMESPIKNAEGLRILNGDFFEIVVSFMISQNNNIKRIKLIIERLCEKAGKDMGEYYAFPTMEEFFKLTEEDFISLGAGYRAKYLINLKNSKNLLSKAFYGAMRDDAARENLLKINGVGPKVADCILLFGLNYYNAFPVDVWIERVYYEYFSCEKKTRPEISKYLSKTCGDLSGFVQQYLFYSKIVKN